MSSDLPNTNPEDQPAEMPARDRFLSAATERMQGSKPGSVERSLWEGRYSPKAMYGSLFLLGAATIAALVLVGIFAGDQQNVWLISGSIILLLWCVAIGIYLYRRFGVHYELTTQRFLHQKGILVRRTDLIEIIDIDDVSYEQGIVQRMLGVGTIKITGSDRSHSELIIRGIDKVPEIASLIDDIRREERRQRSLRIDSI